eukprot:GHUV01034380.1.p1 GENE.GHUV01034380.1~~GHUV01034380.1.p1  ORF type:complete len:129 (-),score=10.03 GHUV01034380.1:491-877(-)
MCWLIRTEYTSAALNIPAEAAAIPALSVCCTKDSRDASLQMTAFIRVQACCCLRCTYHKFREEGVSTLTPWIWGCIYAGCTCDPVPISAKHRRAAAGHLAGQAWPQRCSQYAFRGIRWADGCKNRQTD